MNTSPQLPKLSVIVPARNEGLAIRQSLESLLRQTYPNLEIIAVNDRSTDETGPLMDAVAATDERCRVIHIEELPAGWLGKNHAMHVGAELADGELLLFGDGDVQHEPQSLEVAVDYLQQENLQHLCLLPRMIADTWLEKSMIGFFGMAIAIGQQVHLVRSQVARSYVGVGAFNLIDAKLYEKFGGHSVIRMDVVDDIRLGKLAQLYGGKQDFLMARELMSLRWYHSAWDMICGLEKNAFASLNYSLLQVLLYTVVYFVAMLAPFVLPFVLDWPTSAGFVATAGLWLFLYAFACRTMKCPWIVVPTFPLAAFLVSFAFWRSTWITLRQGGIRWRDSFYSLKELRANRFRVSDHSG